MARTPIPEEAREIPFEAFSRIPSETAANQHDRKFDESAAMDYSVLIAGDGAGQRRVIVNAKTGDEAALKAQTRYPGARVGNVIPASDPDARQIRPVDDFYGREGEAA
jgi:hypothetical protein